MLIVTRGYDSLTIQDITDQANVRRATFYMHYRDKEELLSSALTEIFDALTRETEHVAHADHLGGKTQIEAYRVTFQHAAEHYALYRNILSSQSSALYSRRIRDYLAGLIGRGLQTLPPDSLSIPAEVLANYLAGAELALITWWLENEMPYSATQMAEYAHRLMLTGAQSVVPGI